MDKVKKTTASAQTCDAQEQRKIRLSKALRANLQRRKRSASEGKMEAECPSS